VDRQRAEVASEDFHAREKNTRDAFDLEAEEVLNLRAGNNHGDAVGETDDDGAWYEFDGRAKAGDAEYDEHDSGHDRAHIETVEPIARNDAGNDHDECPGGPADLRA